MRAFCFGCVCAVYLWAVAGKVTLPAPGSRLPAPGAQIGPTPRVNGTIVGVSWLGWMEAKNEKAKMKTTPGDQQQQLRLPPEATPTMSLAKKKQRTESPQKVSTNGGGGSASGNTAGGTSEDDDAMAHPSLDALPLDLLVKVLLLSSVDGASNIARVSLTCRAIRSACLSKELWTVDTTSALLGRSNRLFRRIDPHGCLSANALTTSILSRGGSVASLAKVLQGRECGGMDGRCKAPTCHFYPGRGIRVCVRCVLESSANPGDLVMGDFPPVVNDGFFASGELLKLEDANPDTLKKVLAEAKDGDSISLEGKTINLTESLVVKKAVQIIGRQTLNRSQGDPGSWPSGSGLRCTDNGVIMACSSVRLKNLDVLARVVSESWDNMFSTIYVMSGATLDIDNCFVAGAPGHCIAMSGDGSQYKDDEYQPFASLRLTSSAIRAGMYSIYSGYGKQTRSRIAECRGNIFCGAGDFMFEGEYNLDAPLEEDPGKFATSLRSSNIFEDQPMLTLEFVESKKGW